LHGVSFKPLIILKFPLFGRIALSGAICGYNFPDLIILTYFVFMNCIIGADKISCKLLEEFVGKSSSLNLVGTFSDSVAIRNQLSKQQDIDIVFLDIEIPGMGGFEFIRSLEYQPNIIIVSSGDENALKAFDYNVVDYLLQPVTYSRFCKAVDKAIMYYSKKEVNYSVDKEIYIKKGSSLIKLKIKDLIFIEALENYVILNTNSEKFTIHFTMKAIENQLASGIFIRVHRSFIVNKNMIQTIKDDSLDLIVGNTFKNIPIGKSYRDLLLNNIKMMNR
jgi:DNA-binding LytR/AlgR family response regulator